MPTTVPAALARLRCLVAYPSEALNRLSDDADEIWEPFLTDGPSTDQIAT